MAGKKLKSKNVLLCILIVFVLCAVAGAFSNLSDKDDNSSSSKASTDWSNALESAGLVTKQTATNVSGMSVNYIDVGQGDCILVRCGGQNMLIDSGESEYADVVLNYLKDNGVTYLNYVVATHPHSDHIGSMSKIIENMKIGKFIMSKLSKENTPTTKCYKKMLTALKDEKVKCEYAKVGEILSLGGAEITVLGPIKQYDELNNMSVVLRAVYGKTSFMFMGDAEQDEEYDIIASKAELESDVLKVGHHGSSTSTSYKFLNAVDPGFAVICVGDDNSYNHPNKSTVDRLKKKNIKIYRTDISGTITIMSDGHTVSTSN